MSDERESEEMEALDVKERKIALEERQDRLDARRQRRMLAERAIIWLLSGGAAVFAGYEVAKDDVDPNTSKVYEALKTHSMEQDNEIQALRSALTALLYQKMPKPETRAARKLEAVFNNLVEEYRGVQPEAAVEWVEARDRRPTRVEMAPARIDVESVKVKELLKVEETLRKSSGKRKLPDFGNL